MGLFPAQSVVRSAQGPFFATALVGIHSVILAWNMEDNNRADLLGFSIKRTTFNEQDIAIDMRWLKGQKRFKELEFDQGFEVPSYTAPFQRFRWSDYSLTPDTDYLYEIYPVTGSPSNIILLDPIKLPVHSFSQTLLPIDLYINRGVTSALAYYERFQDKHPSEILDGSAYHWLSRGLRESLVDFISESEPGDSLKIAIYEFFDEGIAQKLSELRQSGVNIEIVFHAVDKTKKTEKENLHVLEKYNLLDIAFHRTQIKISHNKFCILTKPDGYSKLWTGSANFSEAAFHFQTNFAVILKDPLTTKAYDDYFMLLKQDFPRGRKNKNKKYFQDHVQEVLDHIPELLNRQKIIFSPIRNNDILELSQSMIKSAKSAVFLSTPFAMDQYLIDALNENSTDILEYGLVNATAQKKLLKENKNNTRFYIPTRLETYLGKRWDAKMFGAHKIHAKTLIIDPWGEAPAIFFGSANFSEESCRYNDENMIYIHGSKELAAVFTTEFIRMFDHYKSRYFINNFFSEDNEQIRYLEDNGSWSNIYFKKTSRSHKFRDREVFSGLI